MITFLISRPVRLPILLATTKITLEYRLHTTTILCFAAIIKTRRTFEGYGFVVTSNMIPAMHCADRYGKMSHKFLQYIYFAALWIVRFLNIFDLHFCCTAKRKNVCFTVKNVEYITYTVFHIFLSNISSRIFQPYNYYQNIYGISQI